MPVMTVATGRALIPDGGIDYFVDATGGNDANDGRSAGEPWQTIAKVNAGTFYPGDRILFKRGETWIGTQLTIAWSGTPDAPITFSDYGAGAKPIIDGNDLVNCIANNGVQQNIIIRNIECTQGLDHGISFNGACHGIRVLECDCHDCGNDNLILQNGVYDSRVDGGDFYNAYQRVLGPQISGIEIADGSHDIVLSDVTCYGNVGTEGSGIFIGSHIATTMPYNIRITGANCYSNGGYGIYVLKQDANADADRNIRVSDSLFNSNAAAAHGIRVTTTVAQRVNGATFTDCEARENGQVGIFIRGQNLTLIRCLACVRITGVQPARFEDCVSLTVYNCTFYHLENGSAYEPLRIQGAATNGILMRNNILANFANPGRATIQVIVGATTGLDIDYTLYRQAGVNDLVWAGNWYTFANWKLNTGMDANSPVPADPTFTNPGGDDYTLQAGSPAINAGIDVGLPYCEAAPDCGYWEYCP